AAALAWLAVDLPVMIAAPSGWAYFFSFSKNRGADWGSIWYMFENFNVPRLGNPQLSAVNKLSTVLSTVACAQIALIPIAHPGDRFRLRFNPRGRGLSLERGSASRTGREDAASAS